MSLVCKCVWGAHTHVFGWEESGILLPAEGTVSEGQRAGSLALREAAQHSSRVLVQRRWTWGRRQDQVLKGLAWQAEESRLYLKSSGTALKGFERESNLNMLLWTHQCLHLRHQ